MGQIDVALEFAKWLIVISAAGVLIIIIDAAIDRYNS